MKRLDSLTLATRSAQTSLCIELLSRNADGWAHSNRFSNERQIAALALAEQIEKPLCFVVIAAKLTVLLWRPSNAPRGGCACAINTWIAQEHEHA